MSSVPNDLGTSLRRLREAQGLSLRELQRRSGINNAYLSQLERGEVGQPNPTTLARLAEAYDVPVATLMSWAGYTISDPTLSAPQAKALSYFGDASDDELDALKAVFDLLRKRGATFAAPHLTDRQLLVPEREVIQQHAVALLRQADAYGTFPTRLDDLTTVAKLVYTGEIELRLDEKRSLRQRFGGGFDRALRKLQGLINFEQRTLYVSQELPAIKQRFVHAHELGHHVLPVHRELAYLDNWETMDGSLKDACEREANQAAIELLAQGDRLRVIADDSQLSSRLLQQLADETDISLQATARRICEESRWARCAVIAHRSRATGNLMPPHVYPSAEFEAQFRWSLIGLPPTVSGVLAQAAVSGEAVAFTAADTGGRVFALECEVIDTRYARIGLIRKDFGRAIASAITLR